MLDDVRVLHGQWDDDVVAVLPIAWCRHRIAVRQLQGIDDAQDFIEIAARTERIREDQPYFLVRVDDEDGAHGGRDGLFRVCLLYTSPSPRDGLLSRMPSSA